MTQSTLSPQRQRKLQRDLRVLARFVAIYCDDLHRQQNRSPAHIRGHDVTTLLGHEIELCDDCLRLLTHSLVKRSLCPLDPKPACKHCPSHCYHPDYRAQMRQVMRHSGKRLILSGRIDLLLKYFF